jgi:ABC-type antimicrobial peptide transport system permease subunit
MLDRDLRAVLRHALRRPGSTSLAVLTLAVGFGASAALTAVTFNVILPSPVWPDAERLVVLHPTGQPTSGTDPDSLHWAVWSVLSDENVFDDVAASQAVELALREQDQRVEVVPSLYVSSSWLRLLGATPARGRPFAASEDVESENIVLISFSLWQRRYGGDEAIVGHSLRLSYPNPSAPIGVYQIVGVLPSYFEFEGRSPDVVLPLGLVPAGWRLSPQPVVRILGKLHPGASVPRTLEHLEQVLVDVSDTAAAGPLRLVRLIDRELGEARTDGWLLIGAAVSLLLLALINYLVIVGLDTWRRSSEYTLRVAMGATMRDLRKTWVLEGALHGSAAALVGVVIGHWLAAAAMVRMTEVPETVPGPLAIDAQTAVLVGVGGTVLAVVSGTFCRMFQMSKGWQLRLRPIGRGASLAGPGLLVASLAVTLILLFASAVLTQTVVLRSNRALGFEAEYLVFASLGVLALAGERPSEPSLRGRPTGQIGLGEVAALRRQALEINRLRLETHTSVIFDAVRSLPGVVDVAGVSAAPLFGAPLSTSVVLPGTQGRSQPALEVAVTGGYFDTMRIRTLSGRAFTTEGRFAGSVVVSSEFERRYLGGAAEGKTFSIIPFESVLESMPESERRVTVLGVVDDVYSGRQMNGRAPIYYTFASGARRGLVVRLDQGGGDALGALKSRVEEAAPGTLVTMTGTFEDRLALELADAHRRSMVAGLFAALALAVSCVAVWATISRIGLERRKEIALRLAIGASAGSVYALLGREYIRTAGPGLLLGAAGSFIVAQTFRSHFTSSPGLDVGALAVACLLLAVVQALAMLIPGLRAARLDPISALRE